MTRRLAATALVGGAVYAGCIGLSFAFRPIDTLGIEVNVVPLLCCFVVGVLILRALPHSAVGAWLLAAGIAGAVMMGTAVLPGFLGRTGWSLFVVATVAQCLLFAFWLAAIVSYPSSELDRPYERIVVRLSVAAAVVLPLVALVGNRRLTLLGVPVDHPPQVASPLYVRWLAPLGSAYTLLYLLPVVALVLLVLRFRRADRASRRRLEWPLFAALLAALFFAASAAFPGLNPLVASVLFDVATCAVPVAAAIGLLRPQLFDIALVLRRSPVYLVLWLAIAAIYALVAVTLGLTAGERLSMSSAVLVTIVAAVLFQPARERLERIADRLVFGRRLDGYSVLRELGRDLERSVQPQDLADTVTAAAMTGLQARWCRLRAADGTTPLAVAGEPDDEEPALTVPVTYGDAVLAWLDCGPRRDGRYSDRDRDVLAAVARQVGLGLHEARQAMELAASRTRLVQAAEAERRRIERDLHDGVQQDLVALMAKVEVARRRGSDPAVAETLVEAQQLTRRAVQELRQLVQGIHPPVLTDEGLPSAVRSRAGALPFPVRVEVGPGATGRRFDPDSEAAAYFLVCEALTNVAKHAGATSAMVCIDADDHRLCVDVRDDGCGFTGPSTPRGLRGLQDRLEALGGRLDFGSLEGGGAYVRGELPA